MGPIRRALPVAVLAVVSMAVVFPFVLAWRETPAAPLPVTSWNALIGLTLRSLALPMALSLIAAVLALGIVLFGYTVCGRGARRILFIACAIPFVFPPVIVAHAVDRWLGDPHLLLSSSIIVLPAAVFGQAVALRFIDVETLMLSRSLGLPTRTSWRLTVLPNWAKGAALAWMWGVFQLFSDPGIYELYGGHESHLASHVFRAVSAGAAGPSVVRAALLMLVPTVLMTFVVTRARFWRHGGAARLSSRNRIADVLHSSNIPAWVKATAGAAVVASTVLIAGIVLTIAGGSIVSSENGSVPTTSVLPTVILIGVAVPVGAACALVLSTAIIRAHGHVRSYGIFLVIFMLFTSPTAIGAVYATALRVPVRMGETVVIPAVVGGGSAAGGWIGLFLAALAVCTPVSTLLLLGLLSLRTTDAAAAARDLGAGPARVLLSVDFPYVAPMVVASLCTETGALLTNLSPLVFVQPGSIQLATPQLLRLAAGGQSDEAFALAMVTGLLTCGAILGVVILFDVIIDSNSRAWRHT